MSTITTKFDNKCAECGEIAWAGEKVYYNSNAEPGKKIRHERCGDFKAYNDDSTAEPVEAEKPVEPSLKKCRRCDTQKPVAEFSKNRTTRDGLQYECKACSNKRNAEWNQKQKAKREHPEPVSRKRYAFRRIQVLVTESMFDELESLADASQHDVSTYVSNLLGEHLST